MASNHGQHNETAKQRRLASLGSTESVPFHPSIGRTERMEMALKMARDFITDHPAVSGEWPLLVDIIDKALEA